MRYKSIWLSFFFLIYLGFSSSNAEYFRYGKGSDTEFFIIPETHIWRDNPRVWTVKKFSNELSKFTLVYSLQEGDCKKNKLRHISQTWVVRDVIGTDDFLTDKNTKRWRPINMSISENILLSFLCTYVREED